MVRRLRCHEITMILDTTDLSQIIIPTPARRLYIHMKFVLSML